MLVQFCTDLVLGVAMTPMHAKNLAVILTETSKLYEEHFGAIPPPPTIPSIDLRKVHENVKNATGVDILT